MEACVGFATHSGWAVAVTCARGPDGEPTVLDQRRAELIGDDLPRQPYHAVAGLPADEAEAVVTQVVEDVTARSRALLADLGASTGGAELTSVAVVGTPRDIPDVATVLASHARMHASEGELYRRAIVEAAAELGLTPHRFEPDGVPAAASEACGWDAARFDREWKAARQRFGAPWAKDHKLGAMAAIAALTSA